MAKKTPTNKNTPTKQKAPTKKRAPTKKKATRKKSAVRANNGASPPRVKALNRSLHAAKAAKQDEFYTQYIDIQKEVEAYLEYDPDTFRDKVVYCNCDDPFESNFFQYFALNFNKLGLKKLICTSYDGSPIAGMGPGTNFAEYNEGNGRRQKPKALCVILDHVKDEDGDGATNIEDVKLFLNRNKAARKAIKSDGQYPGGDFRSAECVEYLKQADIVVTNPPFSLFREYVAQLMKYKKKFLIIGNVQAITYKEVFPLIKAIRIWMGATIRSGDREFRVPDHYPLNAAGFRVDENGVKYIRIKGVRWWTNLDHGDRHKDLRSMTMADNIRFNQKLGGKGYERYDNYEAIEVPYTDAIPSDYDGVMGVPITFLDKYNPKQFEIVGITKSWFGIADKTYPSQIQVNKGGKKKVVGKLNDQPAIEVEKPPADKTYYIVDGKYYLALYQRILIRHRRRNRGKGKRKK